MVTFHTWVYRIASNYLISYKKSMFAKHPLNFEFYADDIKNGIAHSEYDIVEDMTREKFAEDVKLSCTNVMLQCFDTETKCIFILGTMFKVDSKMAGGILEITPENYRRRLSRARKKMSEFISMYCDLTDTGQCSCKRRVEYAIQQHRLHPFRIFEDLLQELINKISEFNQSILLNEPSNLTFKLVKYTCFSKY